MGADRIVYGMLVPWTPLQQCRLIQSNKRSIIVFRFYDLCYQSQSEVCYDQGPNHVGCNS
ncbi:hypothetical protein HOLleu_08792 [Holothuria leucospilota]|uniref:Uncharacterized protein n=1 Tax=Holothuria leucospilota TaxID=206669 RepID=A0A9Q1CJI3_HOLLE|nr:hypothetical protein HOLleu_08792 [Holothuria leucospilota]